MSNRKLVTSRFENGRRIVSREPEYKLVFNGADGKMRETARGLTLTEAKNELEDVLARCYFDEIPCKMLNSGFGVGVGELDKGYFAGGAYNVMQQ